jgi:hypothetical protein
MIPPSRKLLFILRDVREMKCWTSRLLLVAGGLVEGVADGLAGVAETLLG